jgi:hypothetical protein
MQPYGVNMKKNNKTLAAYYFYIFSIELPLGIFSLSLPKLKNAINNYSFFICILSVVIYIKTFLFKTI